MNEALDIVIFTIPVIFMLRPLFRKKRDPRTIVIKRFKENRKLGLMGTMKESVWYFIITALLAAYAYLRAGLPYLWLIVSVTFTLMALITLAAVIFQKITKQDMPEFPDTITEEAIERGIEKQKKERLSTNLIRYGVVAVWIYSWRSLVRA